jgi:hypothetical protein
MNDDIPVLERMRSSLVQAVGRSSGEERRSLRVGTAWIAAAAVATVVLVGVVLMTLGGDGGAPDPRPRAVGTPEQTLGAGAQCVETFSLDALASREIAFDGVVRSIGVPSGDGATPAVVTFDVTRWYTGGSGGSAELKTYDQPGSVTSVTMGQDDSPQLEVGVRVLASGDGGFLWSCGFSMLYTSHNAEIFEAAFPD